MPSNESQHLHCLIHAEPVALVLFKKENPGLDFLGPTQKQYEVVLNGLRGQALCRGQGSWTGRLPQQKKKMGSVWGELVCNGSSSSIQGNRLLGKRQ